MKGQWELIKPGVIALGKQTITYNWATNNFVWREGDQERGRYGYLADAKVVAERRQSEMEEIGLGSTD